MNSGNYNDNLHKNATGKLYEYARDLRKDSTQAEKILWQHLRDKKLHGLKFRRQHPLDKFIADFYCHAKKLVVELDGGVHDEKEIKEYDEARTNNLKNLNIVVIRFRNEEVMNDVDNVIRKIEEVAMNRSLFKPIILCEKV